MVRPVRHNNPTSEQGQARSGTEVGVRNERVSQKISDNLELGPLMGGSSSGRYRTKNRGAIDSAIRLDVRALRRQGFIKPGAIVTGTQRWSWTATGEERGSVGLTVNLSDPDAGFAEVRFQLNGEPRSQRIALLNRPMRYGGRRYYFQCPRHFRACEVLPMVGGVFASRQAHRLAYHSQSADRLSRLRDRSWKLERRLWPEPGKGRPRGRSRQRLLDAWERADSEFENLFAVEALRRFGHLF